MGDSLVHLPSHKWDTVHRDVETAKTSMWSFIHSTNVLSTECVPDTIIRAEVIWDGDRPVYLSSQANKINKTMVVCHDRGRLL